MKWSVGEMKKKNLNQNGIENENENINNKKSAYSTRDKKNTS